MADTIRYSLQIDWDNDGQFANAHSEVWQDVVDGSFICERGRSFSSSRVGRSQPGRLHCRLWNLDGLYTLTNDQSPLYRLLLGGRRIKWMMSDENDVLQIQWAGRLDELVAHEGDADADYLNLSALGSLAQLDWPVSVPLQQDITTGAAAYRLFNPGFVGGGALYTADNDGDELWRVDVSNPSASVNLGELPPLLQTPLTLAAHGGTMYAADNGGDELWRVDVDDPAASTLIGDLPQGQLTLLVSMASHDGELYAYDETGRELWRVDVSNPSASTLIGAFPAAVNSGRAMASYDGDLYIINRDGDELWRVDVNDPSASVNLGVFPDAYDSPTGLAVAGDLIYSTDFNTRTLWRLDFETPANSESLGVLPSGIQNIRGLAWLEATPTAGSVNGVDFDPSVLRGERSMSYYWTDEQPMRAALEEIEATEGGFVYEQKDGLIAMDASADRVGQRAIAGALTTAIGEGDETPLLTDGYQPDQPLRELANSITTQLRRFSTGALKTLWSGVDISIPAATTIDLVIPFPTSLSDRSEVAVISWTPPAAGTDYTAQTDLTVEFDASGNHATLRLENESDDDKMLDISVRGVPLLENDPIIIHSEDLNSINDFGRVEYVNPSRWTSDPGSAQGLHDLLLIAHAQPSERLDVKWDAYFNHALAAGSDLSQKISVRHNGIAHEYFIEHIRHAVWSTRHNILYRLTPTAVYGSVIVLGVGPGLDEGILGRQ